MSALGKNRAMHKIPATPDHRRRHGRGHKKWNLPRPKCDDMNVRARSVPRRIPDSARPDANDRRRAAACCHGTGRIRSDLAISDGSRLSPGCPLSPRSRIPGRYRVRHWPSIDRPTNRVAPSPRSTRTRTDSCPASRLPASTLATSPGNSIFSWPNSVMISPARRPLE